MNKAQAAAVLVLGVGLGAGSSALLPKSAEGAARIPVSSTLTRRAAPDGGYEFYVRTSSTVVDGGVNSLGQAQGMLLVPAQAAAAATYWSVVVEPSISEPLGKPGHPELLPPRSPSPSELLRRDAGK